MFLKNLCIYEFGVLAVMVKIKKGVCGFWISWGGCVFFKGFYNRFFKKVNE